MTLLNWTLTALTATLVLAGCTTVKPPEKVTLDVPAQYREAAALEGAWKAGVPADQSDRGQSWKMYADSQLDSLINQATEANPGLAIALARVKEARATASVVDANRGFQLNGGFGVVCRR